MKNPALLIIIICCFQIFSCSKSSQSDKFNLLTGPVWVSDSLLLNGVDAGGPGGLLANFKGDAKFNTDYTGYFGKYTGTWRFAFNETQLVIESDSLPIPLTAIIAELNSTSLKITTSFPVTQGQPVNLRMTFKAK
jgi:hypothetical protein